mmetsp:Transcript_25313/g.48370  ORF Transcript_25313/g.48370 Transcript_25313/m.48370 type:complete len:115 (-) Transcript_25313:2-346(-)
MYPLGHKVSLTNSIGMTSFGGEAEAERHLTSEGCEAVVRRNDGRMIRWAAVIIIATFYSTRQTLNNGGDDRRDADSGCYNTCGTNTSIALLNSRRAFETMSHAWSPSVAGCSTV